MEVAQLNYYLFIILLLMSQDISVGIAMGYRLAGRPAEFCFPAGARDFSLLHSIWTSSETHQAPYPVGSGGKAAGV
jgi:hypothetical protein